MIKLIRLFLDIPKQILILNEHLRYMEETLIRIEKHLNELNAMLSSFNRGNHD